MLLAHAAQVQAAPEVKARGGEAARDAARVAAESQVVKRLREQLEASQAELQRAKAQTVGC
jgi:hypothetical protein